VHSLSHNNPALLSNTTVPASEELLIVFRSLEPHYRERVATHPNVGWIRFHYNYIVRTLETGVVGSNEYLSVVS